MADGPKDATRHAGQVVRRVLLRRNIAIDAETAQLVAAAVQAVLQPGAPSRRRQRAAVLTMIAAWLSSRSLLGIAGADRSARPRRDRLTSRSGRQTRRMP